MLVGLSPFTRSPSMPCLVFRIMLCMLMPVCFMAAGLCRCWHVMQRCEFSVTHPDMHAVASPCGCCVLASVRIANYITCNLSVPVITGLKGSPAHATLVLRVCMLSLYRQPCMWLLYRQSRSTFAPQRQFLSPSDANRNRK